MQSLFGQCPNRPCVFFCGASLKFSTSWQYFKLAKQTVNFDYFGHNNYMIKQRGQKGAKNMDNQRSDLLSWSKAIKKPLSHVPCLAISSDFKRHCTVPCVLLSYAWAVSCVDRFNGCQE